MRNPFTEYRRKAIRRRLHRQTAAFFAAAEPLSYGDLCHLAANVLRARKDAHPGLLRETARELDRWVDQIERRDA